jgi:site-specific recombinase XerD
MSEQSPKIRSVPLDQWPELERAAWVEACRPAVRLTPGGGASHLKEVTRRDLVRRHGYFLDFVERTEGLDPKAKPSSYVTAERIDRFVAELKARVSSVTVAMTIYKVRRTAQLLDPKRDFAWLSEIENDLALMMEPMSKFNRLVLSQVLLEAGLTLMTEAESLMQRSALARARQFRNGLMVALLALHFIRLKNYAALDIGTTIKKVRNTWWLALAASDTKEKSTDDRVVHECLVPWIDRYIEVYRPILSRKRNHTSALWLSSNDGMPMTYHGVEQTIGRTTAETIGVSVCPHLFRSAGASTAAFYAGENPYLGSALLHQRDHRVCEKHYNRASTLSAVQAYGDLIRDLRR